MFIITLLVLSVTGLFLLIMKEEKVHQQPSVTLVNGKATDATYGFRVQNDLSISLTDDVATSGSLPTTASIEELSHLILNTLPDRFALPDLDVKDESYTCTKYGRAFCDFSNKDSMCEHSRKESSIQGNAERLLKCSIEGLYISFDHLAQANREDNVHRTQTGVTYFFDKPYQVVITYISDLEENYKMESTKCRVTVTDVIFDDFMEDPNLAMDSVEGKSDKVKQIANDFWRHVKRALPLVLRVAIAKEIVNRLPNKEKRLCYSEDFIAIQNSFYVPIHDKVMYGKLCN